MKYAVTALSFALLAACGTEEEPEIGNLAAEQAATSLSTSIDLADVSNFFKSSRDLTALSEDIARGRALSDVIDAIETLVAVIECLEIDTDNRTYVEVFFDQCGVGPFGVLRLDGAIRADLGFETEPCGPFECPVAVFFELSTVRFSLATNNAGLDIAGSWLIRDPLDEAELMSSTGGIVLTNHEGQSLSMSSAARWDIDDNNCLTLTSESELTINAMPQNPESIDRLGTIVASVQGLERCNRECPRKGTVHIAYGTGQVLRWTYTGADTVVVTGPGGRQFQVVLPCAR